MLAFNRLIIRGKNLSEERCHEQYSEHRGGKEKSRLIRDFFDIRNDGRKKSSTTRSSLRS